MIENTPTISANQKPGFSKSLALAIASIRPKIKDAKEALSKLPLKDVPNPIDGTISMVRIATSDDLQRILMKVFLGDVIVNTIPLKLNGVASVTAYVSILTKDGYVNLPGASASESQSTSITDKLLLSAESRAIRRAIREIGLRAEYEVYDDAEVTMQSRVESIEKSKKQPIDKEEVELDAETPIIDNDGVISADADDDVIPEPSRKAELKQTGTKATSKKSVKPVGKVVKKPAKKAAIKPSSIKHNNLNIEPNYDSSEWPNKKAITYCDTLVKKLTSERKGVGLTVEMFIKSVLGKEAGSNTFRSCSTVELEKLYQFYILDGGHEGEAQ